MKNKETSDTEQKIPSWLEKYIEYKFNLLDRTGKNLKNSFCYPLVSSVTIFFKCLQKPK